MKWKTAFLVSQVLSFRHTIQTSKNVETQPLMFFENVLFEKVIKEKCIFKGTILKMSYLREQFQKCLFEGAISKIYVLSKQFWKFIFYYLKEQF